MGLVLDLRCRACAYRQGFCDGVLLAICDDGTDKICMHPLEAQAALRLTGLDLAELRRRGRLHGGQPMFCAGCGDVAYHRVGRDYVCESCGGAKFHAMQALDGGSTLGSVLGWLICATAMLTLWGGALGRWHLARVGAEIFVPLVVIASGWRSWRRGRARLRLPCPKCGQAALFTNRVGIS